jgi:type III secretion protein U
MSEDKKHEASDKRLEDSREKGQVAISKDIVHLLGTALVFETIYIGEERWRNAFGAIINSCMGYIKGNAPFTTSFASLLWEILVFFILSSVITCCIAVICSLMGTWMQVGILFAPEVLVPKLDKFNPVNNLKQMFVGKNLFTLATTIAKALIVTYMCYTIVKGLMYAIVLFPLGDLNSVYEHTLTIFKKVERQIMMIFLPIAGFDFAMQTYFHKKSLMMSDKELTDEFKEMEGDPEVKGERKQFAHEIVFGEDTSGQAPPATDAVVVNPTHYAVALSYNSERYPIPIVLARAYDDKAQNMIDYANKKNIPVIRYIWLARTLYADGSINRGVPRTTLKAVAFVYRLIRELKTANVDFSKTQEVADDYTNTNADNIMQKIMQAEKKQKSNVSNVSNVSNA